MAHPGSSRRRGGSNKEHEDSHQIKSNLSGLKHALHGTSYQLKLGIVVCLANVKKSLANHFSFAITAEDPTCGKFDDIVYSFKDGVKTGILKIQVKHKLGSPAPHIMLKDFTTTSDTKNPFAILKYFTSFCDQQQSTTDLEGFVICTNSDIDDKAKNMWKTIEPVVTHQSTLSLDSYVSSLFDRIGGKYYRLDYDKIWDADGTFSNFYQLLRKCSKRARLARLLLEATKPNKKIACHNSLFKEYRQAILDIIDRNETTTYESYGFTKEFLNLTASSSMPGLEAFRKEFENQFRQEFKTDECVLDQLKQTRLYVSNDFLSDENNKFSSSKSFPDDNVDEVFKSFCDRFRLVCGTYNERELDDAIAETLRNFFYDDNQLLFDQPNVFSEENMAIEKLFKTNFDWLMDPYAQPLHSDGIRKSLDKIKGTLAYLKLKPISDKFRKKVVGSPFRVSVNVLKSSELYDQVETENLIAVEAFDHQFGATVLLDTLDCYFKNHMTSLLLNDSDFLLNSDTIEAVLRCVEQPLCLIIICKESYKEVQSIVRKWKKGILKDPAKHIFLMQKSSNISSDLKGFRICDLTEESWNRFHGETIPLCTTTILVSKIFENDFQKLSIEEVIRLLDWGKKMEENNEISKKYREIESIYVHRPWVDSESNRKAGNIQWNKDSELYKSIKEPQQQGMTFHEITENLKKETHFIEVFGKGNNPEGGHEPIVGSGAKKVLILLGEAGFGKSTNLTWMAWYLRKQNPSFWVVRCNLSDHCTSFKPFIQHQNNRTGEVIDETDALRMLYKLVCSSLQLQHQVAEKCSKYLDLSNGEAILNEDLMEDLSLNNSIELLVFKEKFNAGKFVLLLDGFDEIAPHYKEVVLNLLTHFELFKGVEKLYLTSRPYGFKEQFEKTFKDPSFFKLQPLSLKDKGSILYKLMQEKWHDGNIDDKEALADFCKSLCIMLLCSLVSMCDIPLNLMMAVDILGERVYHNGIITVNFSSKTFSRKLFELIVDLSKASFIVEEFVKVKIRHLLYDKIGADKNVADKPEEMERFDKTIDEAKLLHGLVALWVLFNYKERHIILSANEIQAGEDYKRKIQAGSEKTGIIHASTNGGIRFIHRKFAEYLAAWWFVKQRIEGNKQGAVNMPSFELFWNEERKELRRNVDTILAKRFPLHIAIIEKEWKTVESLLSENLKSLYKRDDGNRTPFHLIALYYDFETDWPPCLPDSIESNIINIRDQLYSWTAMDYAFYRDKPRLICYLLHHGASINVEVLYDQIVSSEKDIVHNAAKYTRYVMGYLSSEVIRYESHDACRKMKHFCDTVVANLDIETTINFGLKYDRNNKKRYDNENSAEKIVDDIIDQDSVWMLQSIIHRWAGRKHFVRMIRNTISNLESTTESIFMLKYFKEKDPFILYNDNLWDCIILSVTQNYKDEFKYFFDLYCSRFQIKDFHPCLIQSDSIDCSIQSDEANNFIDYVENNIKNLICDFRHNIYLSKLEMPTEIIIDEQILSLLIICLGTVRPSMLKYLIESCNIKLCAGIVYSLAMIADNLFSKLHREAAIKPSNSYECLLDLASNISNVQVNKILRLAITSQLFEFSKCLIERFKIDFQAGDETNGWNVFHLCASNQRSILVEKLAASHSRPPSVDGYRTDLFRYMLAKEPDMDCFGLIDKRGQSVLLLAMENGQIGIVEHIVARKLGLNQINQIKNLTVDAIPYITFCYRAILEISKSIEEKWWHYNLMCTLAKQIVKISMTNREESQELNSGRSFLQEDATELYQIAINGRSLFLMYYLHREFLSAIPPLIYDANWLACTARSLRSPDFLDVTKWLLNPNEVDKHDNLYEVVEKCDAEGYEFTSVDLEKLPKQVEATLSANRSVEVVCKLKLLAFAVCLKRESLIRHLCESFNVNIDFKVLIDIMVIAHHSFRYEPRTKDTDGCAFEKPDFIPITKYLFKRTSNLGEIDAEGRNVLHVAAQNGLGCMAKFLIKHNMVNVTTTNVQNGWNIFHYYGLREINWCCCKTKNDELLILITKRVLEITSDGFPLSSLTESRRIKLKELCFNSDEGRKSVIHVAVEAGNINTAEYIIRCRLGIARIGGHKIGNSDECSRFKECHDELSQIAAQLPFNGRCDYLLHRLAKSILRFSPENIDHIKGQENVEDHIVEDACRSAIKYRSLITLEHLIIASEDQMDQSLARSTSNELVSCMMECIRRNRTSMFKVFVGHVRTLQGIQARVEVEYEAEENDNIDEAKIDEYWIKWRIINQFTEDVAMNRDYLFLLILSVAYGRLSMTRYLVEMLQLKVNKSLILLIMKVLKDLWNENCMVATPVYEYLVNRCEGKSNLLHLFTQAGCYKMLKYLIEERKLDPNEVDSENGWNAGHYCVSDPISSGYNEFTWLVDQHNIDCLGVYDRNGRSIFHLALENGRTRVVKYIINRRLGLIGDKPWYEWDSEKIEKLIDELQQTIKLVSENITKQKSQIIHDVLDTVVCYMGNRAFANFGQISNPVCENDTERNENKNREDSIGDNSVSILMKDQTEVNENFFFELITNSYFDLALESKSVFLLAYFMESGQSRLPDEYLWKCVVYASLKNYNTEFKYFFDLYCCRYKIKDFQPCSIQTDKAYFLIDYSQSEEKDDVYDRINNICWSKLGIPTEITINEKLLSLLVIFLGTERPSMLRYLIESCKLNLCPGIVYSLAMITNNNFSKIHREAPMKPSNSYECLLDLASHISEVEANVMLRLAIRSNLLEFSKCLIERYKIDLQAVDDVMGWNVFHLCASNQLSTWATEMATNGASVSSSDDDNTDLFRYMLTKEPDMDCFGLIDERGQSVLHLALENGHRGIVEHIVARKLGLKQINQIKNLTVVAIPNIIFCYRAIQEISKSVEEKWWKYELICMLAKQIVKMSLTNREESQELNSGRLLLQEDATELYQMAMKRRSLFLMYYLHREFPTAIPSLIYDENWLVCTARSLRSLDFFDVTKWLLNPNEVDKHDNLYEVVEKCDAAGYEFTSVDLEKLIKQAEAILSANRSVEELCKLKLLAVAVCLKRESMIRHFCDSFNLNIDFKVLIDIMVIAHHSFRYEPGTKDTDGCAFEKPDFIPIYKYLFERTYNLGEIDAKGSNVLQCVTATNVQNGWNPFHYYASREITWCCCKTKNDKLLTCMTKRVLGITSDDFPLSSLTKSRKNKLKELCFNSDEGRKSVIFVAVEAGNINTAEYIIECRLGIGRIDKHEIRNSDECSRFRECYDELSQIAAQLPFNAEYDYLLHKLAKSIHKYSPENIEHIKGQENIEVHVVEDACRSAIKYRSLITMEHLFNECEDQMDQALARSTSNELVSCMMECIRRNRTSMFKVFVGHVRTLEGIEPRLEVELEEEENDNIDEVSINEYKINWRIIGQFTEDVVINRDYLPLFIWLVAYGRLSMTRYLVEMLELEINKSLILLIMKVLKDLWNENCKVATPVYEYLANRCEGKPNLLHLCTQAGCYKVLKYLIEERKLDPNEIDSENGWNAGHYCVSGPNVESGYKEFTWLVDQYNMDCFGVYDRKGRNILHLALENDCSRVVKYIIIHRLFLTSDVESWYECDSEKIEKLLDELLQTIKLLTESIPQQKQQIIPKILDEIRFERDTLTTCKQLFTNQTGS